ncbi:MAG TPA: gamma-glutamylcyclotransferase family protein [Solirubrobacteraceae bacterium]|jgi:gamma-glutamylcyclotransferase (GGCT)/AIG2-like uncharacterized protein YtfP|nr:gamma-glutamylcyclotransferase family protein [Solirubrobacteraceae bacterium]
MPALPYFAYGRNMSASAIELACPGHRYLGRAQLPDHRLALTRRSRRTGTGVADVLAAPGAHVWGALYELDDADLAALDRKEGNGWAYERRAVRVRTDAAAGPLDAFAYAVIAPDGAHVQPSDEYLDALLTGARERGLPGEYVEALAALALA